MNERPGAPGAGMPEGRPLRPDRARAPRPDLPDDVAPDLPRRVHGELRQHVRDRQLLDDVAVALTVAVTAMEEGRPDDALAHLRWAKQVAPRSPSIRETLAIAHYHAGDYRGALGELRAYRRMSASHDQDHLVADCLRATGRSASEVGEVVQEMLASDAPADRRLEAILVWAGAVADGGDLPAARAALRRADAPLVEAAGEEARERLTFLVGDLAERSGDRAGARAAFERLAVIDDDPYGAALRLRALRDET